MTALLEGFLRSARRHPERPALTLAAASTSYAELERWALRVAASLEPGGSSALAGVLGYRSLAAYAGVLGVLASGRAFVPLNPRFPARRLRELIEAARLEHIVVGPENIAPLRELLALIERPLTLVMVAGALPAAVEAGVAPHRLVLVGERTATLAPSSELAYVMFTSGSTGTPKGVPILQSNAEAYVDHLVSCFEFTATDVFSQTFDLSFDLSVHDLFVCWRAGGCLAVVPEASLLSPAKWARTNGVTVWFSVPSMAMVMADLGTLKPDALAGLRISFFCGEALPASVVERWRAAAPRSAIVNLYGPTEATIAIASYTWNPGTSPAHCRNGVVPIGAIFPAQRGRVADERGRALAKEHEGELWLAGSQVAAGYLDAPERTRERFVAGTAQDGVSQWYRTGDRVVEDADGVLHYLGRFDDQIKIRGHRFELLEIEHVLRRAAGAASVACVGWPSREGHAEGVVGFVAAPGGDVAAILAQCRAELPDYAVPKRLIFIGELPLNANGKVSRAELIARLNCDHEA